MKPRNGESVKSHSEKVKGKYNSSVGKVKQLAGNLHGDNKLEKLGRAQRSKGTGQELRSTIKETIQIGTYALGDGVKRVGRMLQKKGRWRAGKKVEKIGDKLKHAAGE